VLQFAGQTVSTREYRPRKIYLMFEAESV
jgi:hypothetical protein